MKMEPKLEAALVWDGAGHLAETAVTALVDGELGILPDDAVRHAEGCSLCAERVGQAALLAVDIDVALEARRRVARAVAPVPASAVEARRPLPWVALVAAFVVAVAGQVPTLRELPTVMVRLPAVVLHALPVYARAAALAMGQAHSSGLLLKTWFATATLLVIAGFLIARLAPRPLRYERAS